jgi:threonine dehydratase
MTARLEQAGALLRGVAHRTPVLTSRTLDAMTGASVHLKCENLQRVGAFKFRGAYNAITKLPGDVRARGVVAYSSGNRAQAVALTARLHRVPGVIVMPSTAVPSKLEATKGYGAEVVHHDLLGESREETGARIARERGMTLIPPFDHPDIVAGQGTAAVELLGQAGALDALLVCLGGGGLLSGCALAARVHARRCEVIGVEPEAGDDGARSFRSGKLERVESPDTIADGARTTSLGELTFSLIRRYVSDVITVPDEELVHAMRFVWTRMKIVVEPTGVLALAALMSGRVSFPGRRVGVILSGGNIDLPAAAELFRRFPER